jgi:hypothetical protein
MGEAADAPETSGASGRYVNKIELDHHADNSLVTKLNSLLVTSNKIFCYTLRETSEPKAEWMLDSGASRHFTFDINDFVSYETIDTIPVRTATSFTSIVGKGTVILEVNGQIVRISPVYHIPDLSSRLMSLGQFLKSGLFSRGSAREISLHEDERNFLTFYPRDENDSIYVIKSLVKSQEDPKVETIYSIDFNIMHR